MARVASSLPDAFAASTALTNVEARITGDAVASQHGSQEPCYQCSGGM